MAAGNRKQPKRAPSSESRYSLMEFMRDFPDDAACLDWLWRNRYSSDGEHAQCPKCDTVRTFRRYATAQQRQSWTCTHCGWHLQPTAGTIFHKSSTSLHLWFYAIYLMTSTRCGISAKQLERELGVTYKTAWRMFRNIRTLLAEDVTDLDGTVEVDETYVGGKIRMPQGTDRKTISQHRMDSKVRVLGMVERRKRVRATVANGPILPDVVEHVFPSANVYTDEHKAYNPLGGLGYQHRRVHHSATVYVVGDVHTNTIEGFWSLVKRGISGAYHAVGAEYLQSYLDEYTFRYNHRDDGRAMFETVCSRAAEV